MHILFVIPFSGTLNNKGNISHYILSRTLKGKIDIDILRCKNSHLTDKVNSVTNFIDVKGLSNSNNKFMRLLNIISFSINVLFYKPKKKYDLIIGSSPEHLSSLAAYYLSKKMKCAFALEIRDIYPDTLNEIYGYNKLHPYLLLLEKISDFLHKKAKFIITRLKHYDRYLNDKCINKNIFHLPNMHYLSSKNNHIKKNNILKLCFFGTDNKANSLYKLINTIARIKKTKNISLVFDVYTELKKETRVKLKKLDPRINILPQIDNKQIPEISNMYDFGCCYFNDYDIYNYGLSPSKVSLYSSLRLPIILFSDGKFPYMNHPSIIKINTENSNSINEKINELISMNDNTYKNLKNKILEYYDDNHSSQSYPNDFIKFIQKHI